LGRSRIGQNRSARIYASFRTAAALSVGADDQHTGRHQSVDQVIGGWGKTSARFKTREKRPGVLSVGPVNRKVRPDAHRDNTGIPGRSFNLRLGFSSLASAREAEFPDATRGVGVQFL
jgi:hypothetical protein